MPEKLSRLEKALAECESARLEYRRVTERYLQTGNELAFANDQLNDAIAELRDATNEELNGVL